MDIEGNLKLIKQKIANSALKSGRNPDDIKIVAVCKHVGPSEVIEAMNAEIYDFAENRVQNLLEKQQALSEKPIDWHLIGHLQTNKVKDVIKDVSLIHSVDSIHLVEEIEKQAQKLNSNVNCLLQLNISGEEQKYGLDPQHLIDFLEKVTLLEHVNIQGLMTIAPKEASEAELRKIFSKTRSLYVDISKMKLHNINMVWLSMGMSGDYEYAIEEGSNMIRIGNAIFC